MHDVSCKEKQPLMKEQIDSLKLRTQSIEAISVAIKLRIGYIDGNTPPKNEGKETKTPSCLSEELHDLYSRLSSIEQILEDCNNRLSNQLG